MTFAFTRSLQLSPNVSTCLHGHQRNDTGHDTHQRRTQGIFEYERASPNVATPSGASFHKKQSWGHMKSSNDPRCYWAHDSNAKKRPTLIYKNRNNIHSQNPQFWKAHSICGTRSRELFYNTPTSHHMLREKRFQNSKVLAISKFDSPTSGRTDGDGGDCGVESEFYPKKPRTMSRRRTSKVVETTDESGYVIKMSKELMGVFQYVEKVKRAHIQELANTLRQVALACLLLSCMKGVVTPLVEVFKTQPPSWGKLIMILGAFDAFAITYLALKASEPLERLSSLATETNSSVDMMGSIEKEEEHMLALAIDLVILFRRLRNLALCTAVTQFAHILHAMLQLQKSYPNFAINIIKFVKSWLSTPWV